MKSPSRVIPLVLIGLIAAFTLTAGGGSKEAKVWSADEIKWTENPTMKGFWIAPLWGDPSKGAYGALKKIPGGTDLGWHSHTSEQKVVAVSGTIDFTLEGGEPKVLTGGSFVWVPGGTKHHSACRAGADCVFFEQQPGKTDVVPAK